MQLASASTAAAISNPLRATIDAAVNTSVTRTKARSDPSSMTMMPPAKIRAPTIRQICASSDHCSERDSESTRPKAKTAAPTTTAVIGVGSSATAPRLTATTPKPIRMLNASEPVSRAARAVSLSNSAWLILPSCSSWRDRG